VHENSVTVGWLRFIGKPPARRIAASKQAAGDRATIISGTLFRGILPGQSRYNCVIVIYPPKTARTQQSHDRKGVCQQRFIPKKQRNPFNAIARDSSGFLVLGHCSWYTSFFDFFVVVG